MSAAPGERVELDLRAEFHLRLKAGNDAGDRVGSTHADHEIHILGGAGNSIKAKGEGTGHHVIQCLGLTGTNDQIGEIFDFHVREGFSVV